MKYGGVMCCGIVNVCHATDDAMPLFLFFAKKLKSLEFQINPDTQPAARSTQLQRAARAAHPT